MIDAGLIEAARLADDEATDATLEWKRIRGVKFLLLVDQGETLQVAYKRLDQDFDLIELERRAKHLTSLSRARWLLARDTYEVEESE